MTRRSTVLTPSLRWLAVISYALLPEADHPPVRQRMVLLKRAGPVAERFYQYMQGTDARAILRRRGFAVPQ